MAEVYLLSRTEKNLALACKLCDVVSAGVRKTSSDQKLNPMKLERLFKRHDISHCWPQKPERLLSPEDAVDFNYVLTLQEIDSDIPYACWAADNPDEAKEMKEEAAGEGKDWKSNFKSSVMPLRDFDKPQRDEPLLDPVPPNKASKFGVRQAEFEKHFDRIKCAVDQFLLRELSFDVETNRFIKKRQ